MADFRDELLKMEKWRNKFDESFESYKEHLIERGFIFKAEPIELLPEEIDELRERENRDSIHWVIRDMVKNRIYNCIEFPKYIYYRERGKVVRKDIENEGKREFMCDYFIKQQTTSTCYFGNYEDMKIKETRSFASDISYCESRINSAQLDFERIVREMQIRLMGIEEEARRNIALDAVAIQEWKEEEVTNGKV